METQARYANPLTLKNKSLHFSIVRIASGNSVGSGCLLDGGRVLTCAHNLPDTSAISLLICDAEGVFKTPIRATLEKMLPAAKGDLALLRIEGDLPAHTRPLILADEDMSQNSPCAVYGFPATNKTNGLIFNQARIDSFNTRSAEGWRQMILADADPVGPGFSGSPILDTRLGLLVGMVLQQNPDTQVLVRGIPAQTISARLGLPLSERSPYPGLIERIDKRFLLAEQEKEGTQITPEKFYMADGPAQWWGVMNRLVAPKTLYHGLPQRVSEAFYDSAPVLALFDGSGGMGKTTAARQLVADLCERFECWWVDELGGEDLDEAMPEFLESRAQSGRETLVVLDDWGKYSEGLRRTFGQFMRRQLRKGESPNLRFVVTAKPDEHADLSHDHILLAREARASFDAAKYLKTDNENLLQLALARLAPRLVRLYETLFHPEDRLIGKPFHLLFILLRAADDPELRQSLSRTLSSAEGKFRQVMQYDFDRFYRDEERKGLAVAMLFFAYVKHTHGYLLTYKAFVALANHYSTGKTSPGQRLAAQAPEEWPILSHYLTKRKKEGDKRSDASMFIEFKKDEYAEYLLQLNLAQGQTATAFLEEEKKLIVQFLLENGGNRSASILAHIFSQKEPLLTEQEQVATVEEFLSRGISHHSYTALFLMLGALPSVSFEQKWAWIKRFNEFAPKSQSFHSDFIKFIKQAQKETWFDYVRELTTLGADSQEIWFSFLNGAPAETKMAEAKRFLKESKSQAVLCRCLGLLGDEAKPEARLLLKIENQNPLVINRCLDLLGEEAKPAARELLKVENQNPFVLCRCLDLLGEEAKPEARRLLKVEDQHPFVLCLCLNLLGEEAKPEARRLLKVENQHPNVLCLCLNLLGEEAKPEARELLKVEKQNFDVLCRCLALLGEEAKPEARRLLKESKDKEVLCRCLDLLGEEAKPEARLLLKESKDKEVLCRCLDLLGEEAKPEARLLLKVETQHPHVLCRCLQIMKECDPDWLEARDYCLRIFQNWEKENQQLVGNCLNYLPQHPASVGVMQQVLKEKYKYVILYSYIMRYGYGQHDFWKQEVRRVVQNWRRENRMVLGSCLIHLESEPAFVLNCCQQILQRWEPEYTRTKQALAQKKRASDRYLQKALAHPQLRPLASATAQAMYACEQAEPGFLTFNLREIVFGIVEQGVWPAWESAAEAAVPEQ